MPMTVEALAEEIARIDAEYGDRDEEIADPTYLAARLLPFIERHIAEHPADADAQGVEALAAALSKTLAHVNASSPGPWEVDDMKSDGVYGDGGPSGRTGFIAKRMRDARGVSIFDSLNSEGSLIEEDIGEESVFAWDITAERDFAAASAAVNYVREHGADLIRRLTASAAVKQSLTTADGLHPRTADLVNRFARALAEKLAAAEAKYGYSDGWASPDWMDECRAHLVQHVAKGDPRDVAAYCAFLWHHGERTAFGAQQPAPFFWASDDFYASHPLPVLHDDPATNAEIIIQALCDRLDTSRQALAQAAAMQVAQPKLQEIKANAAWAMHETDPRRLLPRSAQQPSLPETPDGSFILHRDEYGFATSIDRADGSVLVHLQPGTCRNESHGGAEECVRLLNRQPIAHGDSEREDAAGSLDIETFGRLIFAARKRIDGADDCHGEQWRQGGRTAINFLEKRGLRAIGRAKAEQDGSDASN